MMYHHRKTRSFERLESRSMFAAGDLDTTFSGDGYNRYINAGNDAGGFAVAVQSDGKTVIAGFDRLDNGRSVMYIVRTKVDGTFDDTFDDNGVQVVDFGLSRGVDGAFDVKLDANNKIVICGFVEVANGNTDFGVVRLNTNGSLDTTFSGDGKTRISFGGVDIARKLAILPEGKILVAGDTDVSGGGDVALARINSNGTLDKTFKGDGKHVIDTGGVGKLDNVKALTIAPNGKYIIGCETIFSSSADWQVNWAHTSGNVYRTKRIAMGGADQLSDLVMSSSGKITIVGTVGSGGKQMPAIARLTSTGVYDNSLDGDGRKVFDDLFSDRVFARTVSLYPGGKIMVGLHAENFGDFDWAVARLNSNGSFDTSFDGDGFETYSFPPSPSGSDFPEDLMFDAVIANGKFTAVGISTLESGEQRMAAMRVLLT